VEGLRVFHVIGSNKIQRQPFTAPAYISNGALIYTKEAKQKQLSKDKLTNWQIR
jgi:hypothetical protein